MPGGESHESHALPFRSRLLLYNVFRKPFLTLGRIQRSDCPDWPPGAMRLCLFLGNLVWSIAVDSPGGV
jgi:hypothetical protein